MTGLALAIPGSAGAQVLPGPVTTEPATPDLIDRAQDRGAIDLERASLLRVYALTGDPRLPEAYESNRPWRGTLLDRQLRSDLPRLDPGPERRAVSDALRAPEANTTCSSSVAPLPNERETPNFYIEYGPTAFGGGLGIDDYAASLEEVYAAEVTSFGWAEPPQTGKAATDIPGKYHVRIEPLGPGLYGFVSSGGTYAGNVGDNPNTAGWNEGDAAASCMVLNSDFETGFPGTAQQAMDATTAHEYNHSIQFGYGALDNTTNEPDINFSEGGATWMEDEAQDAANDNYNYLYPEFDDSMNEHDEGNEYAYWLTFRGLTERFGTNTAGAGEQVMQDFWELTSRNLANNLTAMNQALVNKGTNLPDAYHDYAIGARFMETCGAGYVLPYCFEEAAGYEASVGSQPSPHGSVSSVGGSQGGSVEDNYALNWISLPSNAGSYFVTLTNLSSVGSLRGTVACDTGSAIRRSPLPAPAGGGQSQTVEFDSSGCVDATAVITNQTQTAANPSSSTPRGYNVSTGTTPPPQPAPGGGTETTPPGGNTPVADTVRPIISSVGFSTRRFRAARSGAAIQSAPLGTRLRYRLSEAANVSLRYERRSTGRRVGGLCRAATRGNRSRPRCTRWVLVRGVARAGGRAGLNSLRVTGRIGGRTLRPGVYRLRLTARDGAGNASALRRSVSFRIVRR